mmetsp:Transcript_3754/g.7804  ORF Transcript_3754/g.7804 Transcript_3754/m.7804 type:complete len:206 (-) Transcript_3754:1612-2229(-)
MNPVTIPPARGDFVVSCALFKTSLDKSLPTSAALFPIVEAFPKTPLMRRAGAPSNDPTLWVIPVFLCRSLKADMPARACKRNAPLEQAAAATTGRFREGPRSRSNARLTANGSDEVISSSSVICHSSMYSSGVMADIRWTVTPLPEQTRIVVPSGVGMILLGIPRHTSRALDPRETPSRENRWRVKTLRVDFPLSFVSQTATTNP